MRLIKKDLLKDAPTEAFAGYAHEKLQDVMSGLHWAIKEHREGQALIWFWGAILIACGLWDLLQRPSWVALAIPVGLVLLAYGIGARAALRRWERATDEALPALAKEFDVAQSHIDWRRRSTRSQTS